MRSSSSASRSAPETLGWCSGPWWRYANSEAANKKGRFTRSVLGRLAMITLVALGCLLLVRPDGVGVLAGVAIFQMLMLGGASVTTFKQLKQQ